MSDAVAIADDDELYRRLAPLQINPDGTVNSLAFKLRGKPDPSISVDLARLTTVDACRSRAPYDDARVGVLRAGDARALGSTVRHDPLPDNEAHSLIEGRHSKTFCRLLAERVRVL